MSTDYCPCCSKPLTREAEVDELHRRLAAVQREERNTRASADRKLAKLALSSKELKRRIAETEVPHAR